jgi:hypothetical protein
MSYYSLRACSAADVCAVACGPEGTPLHLGRRVQFSHSIKKRCIVNRGVFAPTAWMKGPDQIQGYYRWHLEGLACICWSVKITCLADSCNPRSTCGASDNHPRDWHWVGILGANVGPMGIQLVVVLPLPCISGDPQRNQAGRRTRQRLNLMLFLAAGQL